MREKSRQPLEHIGPDRRSDTIAFAQADTAVTETNRSTLLELPASWLDRLIVLSSKIPTHCSGR
jgi:hypothetical protein